jgi:hypothetical protein
VADDHQPFPRQLSVWLAGGIIDGYAALLFGMSPQQG